MKSLMKNDKVKKMNKNENKYFQTAKKMDDALVFLLNKKDFNFITVKDICNVAKVNRSTFYLHYDNTRDLLDEVLNNLSKSFNEHFKNKTISNIDSLNLDDLFLFNDSMIVPYLEFIKENKNVYKTVKDNPFLFSIHSYMNYSLDIIYKIMDRFNIDKKLKDYYLSFYINGLSSLIMNWCNNDFDLSIEELTALIKGLIKVSVKR